MEILLDCLPCILRQVLEASRMATDNTELHENIMTETIKLLSNYKMYSSSPEAGREAHQIVKKYTDVFDPYKDIKRDNINTALKLYPFLQQFLKGKQNRIYWALKIAATGNVIDSAVNADLNIEKCIEFEMNKEFAVCDLVHLEHQLEKAKSVLVIGDNAGETVFDRILLDELPHLNITYAVRSAPIINDATVEDAIASGLDQCSRVISTGCNAPGVILKECNKAFLDVFYNADIVISKGQGNYETLSDEKRNIFFLLKAKCKVLAQLIGGELNDYIFKYNPNDDTSEWLNDTQLSVK